MSQRSYLYRRRFSETYLGLKSWHERERCNAPRVEKLTWEAIRTILTDPEELRADLERMIELEREGVREDPEKAAKVWATKIVELDRKRIKFQHLYAEVIGLDDLRARLAELDGERKVAERELAALTDKKERLEELEQDAGAILEDYARMAPEALDALIPEERHEFYKIVRLKW